ncbi:hypothetical protein BB559_003667 [Furculomyces boomerangus]|uniref:Cystathionine gamma-synthase n=1 Tax=Furculomyces boomerangus TaxID=61424 RepID=A0A2T9YJQ9_9FUNG|nr:hypothetical protein BB559_003667 [Furculomyces boomerangus]
MNQIPFGKPIPYDSSYAISVSLPLWSDNVAYEEGDINAIKRMESGYPRFFISKSINQLSTFLQSNLTEPNCSLLIFPSNNCAQRCKSFIINKHQHSQTFDSSSIKIIPFKFEINAKDKTPFEQDICFENILLDSTTVYVVTFHESLFALAKQYWQHTGDGISSRQADYCLKLANLSNTILNQKNTKNSPTDKEKNHVNIQPFIKKESTPSYYKKNILQTKKTNPNSTESQSPNSNPPPPLNQVDPILTESFRYIEERYGRNLNSKLALEAKSILKKRISGLITENDSNNSSSSTDRPINISRNINFLSESDVYLTSTGMGAIFHTFLNIQNSFNSGKTVCFGFVYTDTLKILEKFGPGAYFYGNGEDQDYCDLEKILIENPNSISALYTEAPSNPLLKTPDLQKLRNLADKYNFVLVVDETIGNIVNLNTLAYADVAVSSLSKLFSGDSNVMGGSIILNPASVHYKILKSGFDSNLEDLFWWEDAIFMERNSRNFVERSIQINKNAELVVDLLLDNPHVERVYYPKTICNENYEKIKRNSMDSGYGGLLSVLFKSKELAIKFYDNLDCSKGPSLGTNFTLASPYTLLAHYNELEWAAKYGVSAHLIRISVGLESQKDLLSIFKRALESLEK